MLRCNVTENMNRRIRYRFELIGDGQMANCPRGDMVLIASIKGSKQIGIQSVLKTDT